MTPTRKSVSEAKRYIDSALEIDRRAGQSTEVPTEIYERVVNKIAAVTQGVRLAAKRAGRAAASQ